MREAQQSGPQPGAGGCHPRRSIWARRGFSLLDGLIGVMIVVVLGVFLYPWLSGNRVGEQRATCAEHTHQLSLAMLQYAQDYDTRYPKVIMVKLRVHHTPKSKPRPSAVTISVSDEPVAFGLGGASYGWADALFLYIRDPRVYQCPAAANAGQTDPTRPGYTDYWYNRNLANLPVPAVTRPANTLLLGEGNDGSDATDARYCLSSLPPEWPINVQSPPFRHAGGALYAFADGHAQWLTPGRITSENGGDCTFSLQ